MNVIFHLVRFFSCLTIVLAAAESLPLECSHNSSKPATERSSSKWWRVTNREEELDPDHPLCLLNLPSSDSCKHWRVVGLILLKDEEAADEKTEYIREFLNTVTENCQSNSNLIFYTPTDENELCLNFQIGSDTEEDYLHALTREATVVGKHQQPGQVMENMLNRLMECTAREPFSEDEAGAIYVFSDFTCEEMCADSDIAQIANDLLINLTYYNKFVVRMYWLANFTQDQTICLNTLFAACVYQQSQLCDLRFYSNLTAFEERANLVHTCPVNNGLTTLGLILAISIPCLLLTLIVIILVIICIRHRLKKKWFHFWFEHTRKKAYSENESYNGCHNDYLDIDRLREHRVKDLWEVDPDNLEVSLNHLLGTGAFASVYKGRLKGSIPLLTIHSSLKVHIEGRQGTVYDVAVKRLPTHADEAAKLDFQHEMEFMKTLGYHLHIISLIGCVTSKIEPLIVVEYAHHGDLLKFLRTHKSHFIVDKRASVLLETDMSLTLKDLLSFSWQTSDGMVFLSSNKYIHRDLAARNILLTRNLVAKIGDFGLCRELDSMLYTGRGGRLPIKWMAPESLRYYEYSSKSDVWSFAVLLYEIFSLGETPYPTIQPVDMPEHLEQGNRLPRPEHCPEELHALMEKCWNKSPDIRPNFIQIREELRKLLNSQDEQYGYLPMVLGDDLVEIHEEPVFEVEEQSKL